MMDDTLKTNRPLWIALLDSVERSAVGAAIAILCLCGLSFSLNHNLESSFQLRFLVSGVMLAITCIFLRFGLTLVEPIHRASYRMAFVMMVWSIGLYFFSHPNFVLYLVALPGIYFLIRVEIKKDNAPKEDLIASGILLALSLFLYIQQQPLQVILFDNGEFDWSAYYFNAPCMLIVGAALLRFQYWLRWDGIAFFGTAILLLATVLSLSMLVQFRWFELREFVIFVVCAQFLLSFLFIKNPLYETFVAWTGVNNQALNYKQSVFALVFVLSQFSLVMILQVFSAEPIFAKQLYYILLEDQGNLAWYCILLLANLSLLVYSCRQWSISLLAVELAIIIGVVTHALATHDGTSLYYLLANCLLIALFFALGFLKRQRELSLRYNVSVSVIVILVGLLVYAFLFIQTDIFTPVGLIGFILPLIAWIYFPGKPAMPIKNIGYYCWPLMSLVCVLCLVSGGIGVTMLAWSLATIIIPLLFSFAMLNKRLLAIAKLRSWKIILEWKSIYTRFLTIYAFLAVVLCLINFVLSHQSLIDSWQNVLALWACLFLSACALLLVAIVQKRLFIFVGFELTLWLGIALLRWKLDVNELMSLGSPIDGYCFIFAAVLVAGIREKARNYSVVLGRYFTCSTAFYSVAGWCYLVYLSLQSTESYHGEMASMLMAGLFYWLARQVNRKLQIFVFVFVNVAIALLMSEIDLNNPLFYIVPVLTSALILTQLFKEELSQRQIYQIRLYCGLILLGVSAAYNMLDFKTSIWYPVAAVLLASLVVVVGISFRIRIFLYLGTAFFMVNIVGVIANVILTQPDGRVMFAVGVLLFVMGLIFISSYLLFQMKRDEILTTYRKTMDDVSTWD